jgi:zinc protease
MVSAAGPAAAQQNSQRIQVPTLPVVKYALPNGLTVLLSEDRSAPIAAVTVWYHVGSKNEKPGRTGFAHLFEHMMFTGSKHIPEGQHPKILESIGADLNGTTNNDRTLYYDVVPSNQLETALWLESDRMGFLPDAMTDERLNAQRGIVQNERRQGVDNQPFGVAGENVMKALYPAENPYSWPVIGSLADLQAAQMADVKEFFRRYYAPNNAVLSIVGDIDVEKTKVLVSKYFGEITQGPSIERPTVPFAPLAAEKRLVLEDTRASLPQMRISWPTVGANHADKYALAALAGVLTLDRTSRLTKLLVYDRQLATNVGAGNTAFEDAGLFNINVTPRPNASLTTIEMLIDSVLSSVLSSPPTAVETARVRNYRAVSSITGLQSNLSKSMMLADGQSTFADPHALFKQITNYANVTPAEVVRVARKYLTSGRVVMSMVPGGKLDLISKPNLPYTNVTPAAVNR